MERIAFARSETTGRWVKARSTGGVCFTINFDQLEKLLHARGTLSREEHVERFEIDEYGVTVFVEGGPIRPTSAGPRKF